jgi:hypothetical protein
MLRRKEMLLGWLKCVYQNFRLGVRSDSASKIPSVNNEPLPHLRVGYTLFCAVSVLGALFPFGASGQTTSGIPFTPDGIRSIRGKDLCEFQGTFPDRLGVDLDRRKEHAVQYLERDGVIAVFLLSKPTPSCGIVDAALDLTPVIRQNETVQFKCYTDHEGGSTWGKWGHVIGLADNHSGLKRFVRARLAWRVNIQQKRFEQLTDQSVTCDTSGYAN